MLSIVEAKELLDRHPQIQQSVKLRNPYVDPMNAIQVELLRAYRAGDEAARLPLLRSIAGSRQLSGTQANENGLPSGRARAT